MLEMDEDGRDAEQHRAKRRKIDDQSPAAPTATSSVDYIVLARQSYRVNIGDTEVYKSLLKPDTDGHVEILDLEPHHNYTSLRIRVPWLKSIIEVTTIQDRPASEPTLFESCLKLHSSIKKTKIIAEQPLCKYQAHLTVRGQESLLGISILWQNSIFPRQKIDDDCRILLSRYLPKPSHESSQNDPRGTPWSVKDFYDNVHVPPLEQKQSLRLDMVQCKLYPFQERATHWMLSREGVNALPSGQLVIDPNPTTKLPLDLRKMTDAVGNCVYVSNALGVVSTSFAEIDKQYRSVKGGILAEAMGLGKTVEMIALMCSHKRNFSPMPTTDSNGLRETNGTLIVTPPTILEQWRQEIAEHAPGLKVYHYTGMKKKGKGKTDTIDTLTQQDVVLTTYNVIASEIHYVQEKPDRNLRARPRRELPKSPLTQISWWRCLLDEAQMVESGVSNAAIVARLIPRVNAWAVTGTPLKQSHRDLYGLLQFLKYEPWCHSTKMWDYLVLFERNLLHRLIGEVTLRHSKELVRDELRIPAQSRQVASLPFTAIEESHYAQLHHEMQEDCGLDSNGSPLDDEWNPDSTTTVERMRSWLQRLRQTCLHPEVGGRNRRALGRRGGPLRTVAQVLDVMIEQTDSIVHTEQRNSLMAKTDEARLFEHARQSQIAHDMFSALSSEISTIVIAARKDLAKEMMKSNRGGEEIVDMKDEEEPDASLLTARQRLRSALELQHTCIFYLGNTYYQLKSQQETKLPAVRQHMKEASHSVAPESSAVDTGVSIPIDVSEAAVDTIGVLGPEDEIEIRRSISELENQEAKAYEEAKAIRTELLMDVQKKAQARIDTIHSKTENKTFTTIPRLEYSVDDFGGIESRKIFEKLYFYCKAMNIQADQFENIRDEMANMLDHALVDKEEGVELTGDEYEDSTKTQNEMYVMMEMLRALFADRSDAISGQENLLLKQETKTFLRIAKEGEGPAPELMLKLLAEREKKRIVPAQDGSLRGIMTEIRSLATSLEWQESTSERARSELAIVNQLLQYVQKVIAAQSKCIVALEQEVNSFKDAMNARLAYYRALQRISDMVAPIGEEELVGQPVDQAWVNRLRAEGEVSSKKLSAALSKRRYLLHLKNESEADGEARICTICQFEFENGTITVCGHQFCKECIQMWWSEHRNCPVCKRRLTLNDFYDITYKPQASNPENESGAEQANDQAQNQAVPTTSNSIYTTVPSHVLNQVRTIEIRGSSYGSKVDTLIRHVLYLRSRDPGSKCIIFSQYRDFLDVLSRSLRQNEIVHSKFDDKDGIADFKSNPANECFLLHAKAHAAGLNLVCASHVILCEPLINTAIELQAVARVHRIGQQRPTTVWMYLIEGTVEEAIYDISVKRRLAHMDGRSRDNSRSVSRAVSPTRIARSEAVIDAANSKELQAADLSKMFTKGNTGGEMVDKEDLWGCLFGNSGKSKAAGVRRGLADVEAGTAATGTGQVGTEIGRFLRADAADQRRDEIAMR